MNKKEAATKMVNQELSAIPKSIIELLLNNDQLKNITIPIFDENEDLINNIDQILPSWNKMWLINEPIMEEFILNNIKAVSELGFTIYQSDKHDCLILGIDGGGYDFYEAHWIPLYNLQGLCWHD